MSTEWNTTRWKQDGSLEKESRLPSSKTGRWRKSWLACIVYSAVALSAVSSLNAAGELEFAVPTDGRITLGVFDSAGKLVRVLHKLAKEEDFRIGDNGLITAWDGKNEAGEQVAAGAYYVRGYLIGDEVGVSGENFLFNDWAPDPGYPGFKRIEDFALLENGDMVLLTETGPGGNLLARFALDKGFVWSVTIEAGVKAASENPVFRQAGSSTPFSPAPLASRLLLPPSPDFPPLLTANSTDILVTTGKGSGLYALEDGAKKRGISQDAGWAPLAVAANDSRIFISFNGLLVEKSFPDLSEVGMTPPPSPFTSMDADASTLLGASPDGVWIRQKSFTPVTLPVSIKSVALGMSGTFWFVGVENEVPLVGQASFSGEVLRLLRPAEADPKPEKIRASRTAERFAVLESLSGLQRLRVMARSENGEWTIEWERTLLDSARFGFVDGKPAADAGGAPQDKDLRMRLKDNPLTGKRGFLTLHVESDKSGSRLVSPDGLPLVEVSTRADISRVAIHRGDQSDTVRLLQGNGAVIEEFSITGLSDILPLDAGGVEIP